MGSVFWEMQKRIVMYLEGPVDEMIKSFSPSS